MELLNLLPSQSVDSCEDQGPKLGNFNAFDFLTKALSLRSGRTALDHGTTSYVETIFQGMDHERQPCLVMSLSAVFTVPLLDCNWPSRISGFDELFWFLIRLAKFGEM
jgi:hypothetical protein